MSCRFYVEAAEDTDEPNLWWPANNVARLFKGYSESVAVLLGVPSGIGDLIEDECEVDLPVFEKFCAEAVARYEKTNHALLRTLIVGFIGTALALLDRAGGKMPASATPEQQAAWIALRDQQARLMNR